MSNVTVSMLVEPSSLASGITMGENRPLPSSWVNRRWCRLRSETPTLNVRPTAGANDGKLGGRVSSPSASTLDRLLNTLGVLWQVMRSEEHTSELQSRGLISYAVFCLKKKKQ